MDTLDCKICLRKFKTTYSLKLHMTRHTGEKRLISDKCGIGSTESCFSKIHPSINNETPHKCSHCNKTFDRYSKLIEHYKIHSGERPFVCVTCGKSFADKYSLKRHNAIHTRETLYICKVCDKAFALKYNLKRHNAIHTRETLHICKVCGKAYTRKYQLNKHELIHSKDKSNVCKKRGKSSTESGNLKRDNKIQGREPFIFTIRRNDTNIRILMVPENNGQEHHQCKTCDKIFSCRSNLSRHAKLHEKVELDTSPLDVREINLNSTVNIPDSGDVIDTCSNSSMSFSDSTQLELHMEPHQIKDWDQYDSINFAKTEYFDYSLNLEKEKGLEMFSDRFETNSINSVVEADISSDLLSLNSHAEIPEEPTQLNFDISTDNLHTIYANSQQQELKLMSIEELNTPQMFFF